MRILSLFSFVLILLVSCNKTANRDADQIVEQIKGTSINKNSSTIELLNRWEKVWHNGQYDLISSCLGDKYIRHDMKGDRIVTKEEYAKEIEDARNLLPDVRFIVYDNSLSNNQIMLRYTMTYSNPETNEPTTRKGIQIYRIEDEKLAETWAIIQEPGTKWPDSIARKCWSCAQ